MNPNTKINHKIPNDCLQYMQPKTWNMLEDSGLMMDMSQSNYCMRLHNGSFAAMYDALPMIDEKVGYKGNGCYTIIRDDEQLETLDETAEKVLARMGFDSKDTYYWAVYIHELNEANDMGMTKVLSTQAGDYEGAGRFAGFGFRGYEKLEDGVSIEQWKKEAQARVLEGMTPILLWLNNLMLSVVLRDAKSGIKVSEYELAKTGHKFRDERFLINGDKQVKKLRASASYQQRCEERSTGTHIISEPFQDILSDETKAMLAKHSLLISAYSKPKRRTIGGYDHTFFSVAEQYAVDDDQDPAWVVCRQEVIKEEDFGGDIDDIAKNLMARMDDGFSKSYWPVYVYETNKPHKWDHTKIYTTNADDIPEGGGNLVGISIKNNFDMKPLRGDESEIELRRAKKQAEHLAGMSEGELLLEVADWREQQREYLQKSLEGAEIALNNKVLVVDYLDSDTLDSRYDVDRNYDDRYKNNPADFNAKVQEVLRTYEARLNNTENFTAEFLKTYNPELIP